MLIISMIRTIFREVSIKKQMFRSIYIMILAICMGFSLSANESVDKPIYTIPFVKAHGLILLEAEIADQKGFFIFDTGADALLLNSEYGVLSTNDFITEFQSLNGVVETKEVNLQSLTLGNYTLNDIEAYSVNLSKIEALADRKLLGIIGAPILNSEVIHIDNKNNLIQLLPRNVEAFANDKSLIQSEMRIVKGIPVIPVVIDDDTYAFGLDTGSSVSLVCSELLEKGLFTEKSGKMHLLTAAKNSKESKLYSIDKIKIANLSIEQLTFGSSPFEDINTELGIHLDGILSIDQLPVENIYIDTFNKRIFFDI